MKQPELGLKILQLRKAKGLTQEELVDRCNINVRTIQRIEAGEVTPRSYTIKGIMEALDYDWTSILWEGQESKPYEEDQKNRGSLRVAFFVGIAYFVFALVEGIMDFLPVMGERDVLMVESWYAVVKIAVIATYSVFMWGYYKVSLQYHNLLVTFSSILLIAGTVLTLSGDIYSFYTNQLSFVSLQVFKSVLLGAMYIAFGIGIFNYRSQFGTIAMLTGILSIVSGIAFVTVVLAFPGLVIFTIFEVCQLILLYKLVNYHPLKKQEWRSGETPSLV